MGAAASITPAGEGEPEANATKTINLKKLPEAIEESLFVHERFCLIVDPTEQAARFLKYQMGSFVNSDDPTKFNTKALNRALVGALQYGRTLTIKFPTLEGLNIDRIFEPGMFPKEVLSRTMFYNEVVWKSCLKPDQGDPDPNEINIAAEFALIICTVADFVPPELSKVMKVIKVVEKSGSDESRSGGSGGDELMEQVAALYGAAEVVRNSTQLVEAAFDGELDDMKSWIEKGYHLESVDGRKHTALSEAACQGHLHVVKYLLDNGADPNALSDTDRSPMWRASFNTHLDVVAVLLQAGGDPDHRDKVSMESAFDVAQSDDLRQLLGNWDRQLTATLIESRRRTILQKIEERIKTGAEREQFAKEKIRQELVLKAEQGDTQGVREMLSMVAEEADKSNSRPRATAEVRNQSGQSLLSIAAQHDFEELATFLLTYWKECDKERWDLAEGELSVEAKTFKTNPNSRDMKGWTCVCIAVFHDSKKVLKLLLDHGGDPGIRSTYNKNAWDLSRDELDAAEHVIKSRAEIRQVLIDNDRTGEKGGDRIFGAGGGVAVNGGGDLYDGLEKDGSPVVMQLEMNGAGGCKKGGNKKGGGGGVKKKGKK